MKKYFMSILCVLAMAGLSKGVTIWGTTGNGSSASSRSEVFTIDTNDLSVTILYTTPGGWVYGDIAVTPSGEVYTVGKADNGAWCKSLVRLDPNTGQVKEYWKDVMSVVVTGLTAESDTSLLGLTNADPTADVIRIALDSNGDYLSATNLGRVDSQTTAGGDLAHTPDGDYIAATDGGTDVWRIGVENGNPNPGAAVQVCSSLSPDGIGAFAFDYNDPALTLYAGTWKNDNIYTLDLDTCVLTAVITDISQIGGGIYGMGVAKPVEGGAVSFMLSVSTAGDGSVQIDPNVTYPLYDPNADVNLVAIADYGWDFSHWSGDISDTNNPVTIKMNSNKNIIANFELDFTLTESSIWGVTGNGTTVNDQSEVFVFDANDHSVIILHTTEAGWVYGDIAVTGAGKVYTVGMADSGSWGKSLMRLDPNTGQVEAYWKNVIPYIVNGLAAVECSPKTVPLKVRV